MSAKLPRLTVCVAAVRCTERARKPILARTQDYDGQRWDRRRAMRATEIPRRDIRTLIEKIAERRAPNTANRIQTLRRVVEATGSRGGGAGGAARRLAHRSGGGSDLRPVAAGAGPHGAAQRSRYRSAHPRQVEAHWYRSALPCKQVVDLGWERHPDEPSAPVFQRGGTRRVGGTRIRNPCVDPEGFLDLQKKGCRENHHGGVATNCRAETEVSSVPQPPFCNVVHNVTASKLEIRRQSAVRERIDFRVVVRSGWRISEEYMASELEECWIEAESASFPERQKGHLWRRRGRRGGGRHRRPRPGTVAVDGSDAEAVTRPVRQSADDRCEGTADACEAGTINVVLVMTDRRAARACRRGPDQLNLPVGDVRSEVLRRGWRIPLWFSDDLEYRWRGV